MDRAMLDSLSRNEESPRLFGGTGGVEEDGWGVVEDIRRVVCLSDGKKQEWTERQPASEWTPETTNLGVITESIIMVRVSTVH